MNARILMAAAAALAVVAWAPLSPAASDAIPNELAFSTWLGGEDWDYATDVAFDSQGNVWVTGYTPSAAFPVTLDAVQPVRTGLGEGQSVWDAFLTKFSPSGEILYSTFWGAPGREQAHAVAVDPEDNVVVGGYSQALAFPTTDGAYDTAGDGAGDIFISKFDNDGQIIWSTLYGGSQEDPTEHSTEYFSDLAIDDVGDIYVTGVTFSDALPGTTGAFQETFPLEATGASRHAGFVAKIESHGGLAWSTYLGGSFKDKPEAIAVGADGAVYVTGTAESLDFPTTDGSFQPEQARFTHPNFEASDAFLTKIVPDGSAIAYSTFFGGGGRGIVNNGWEAFPSEHGQGVVVDDEGHATIVGLSGASSTPVTADAAQPTHGATWGHPDTSGVLGAWNGFIATFDPTGSSLLYASYLGGEITDRLEDAALDAKGRLVVVGTAQSSLFPTTPGAYQSWHGHRQERATWNQNLCEGPARAAVDAVDPNGTWLIWDNNCPVAGRIVHGPTEDAVLLVLDRFGPTMHYGSFFGGPRAFEWANSLAVADDGSIAFVGNAGGPDMPLKNAARPVAMDLTEGFVVKFAPSDQYWPCLVSIGAHCGNIG